MPPKGSKSALDDRKSGRSGSPAKSKPAASAAPSNDGKRQKAVIWPEWSDVDVNAEKWEAGPAKGGKEKDKGKSPVVQMNYFDDPDGRPLMPPSLRVASWKRPAELMSSEQNPVVVDPNAMFGFDLMTNNEHILHSELIRWIISQIHELWKVQTVAATGAEPAETPVSPDGQIHNFRPWEHIFAINKITKGPYVPQYNPFGKYIVKLFWLGCWRKIVIDDAIPFDDQDRMLLPVTMLSNELWPMLLTKALIKVASLDYGGGPGTTEFGDFSVIQCLTGWLPQTIVVSKDNPAQAWHVLRKILPEWTLPVEPKEVSTLENLEDPSKLIGTTPDSGEKEAVSAKEKGKKDDGKGKDKGKDAGKDKKQEKSKTPMEESMVYENPEVVVFASYFDCTRKQPFSVTSLGDFADRSESLRTQGLSHLYSHPVRLTQTRACPLIPPEPPEEIPAWKLIRPKVNKMLPTSEEAVADEGPVEKPIQCLEMTSALVNYRVAQVPIPTSTSRPQSALTRGSTRAGSPRTVPSVQEWDETAPDWDIQEKERKEREEAEARAAKEAEELRLAAEAQAQAAAALLQAGNMDRESKRISVSSKLSTASKDKKEERKNSFLETQENSEGVQDEAQLEKGEKKDDEGHSKTWIDLDKFLECFQSVHIYHKTPSYPYQKQFMDTKNIVTPGSKGDAGRKSATASTPTTQVDERLPQFLLVDSLEPTEVIFCLSALCRWLDPPPPPEPQSGRGTSVGLATGRPKWT